MMTISRPWAIFPLLIATAIVLHSCPDDDTNLLDCSNRGKPQHWDADRKEWTCK